MFASKSKTILFEVDESCGYKRKEFVVLCIKISEYIIDYVDGSQYHPRKKFTNL